MLKVKEEEFNLIIHDLLNIASVLKGVEDGRLTQGQKEIIHGCETRLREIRQSILESIEDNNGESKC